MGKELGFRILHGHDRQTFVSLRYQTHPAELQKWLEAISHQLPLHEMAEVDNLPVDAEKAMKPLPPRPALRLPKTYDGPIWRSTNAWATIGYGALASFLFWASQTDGPEDLKWIGGFLLVVAFVPFYFDHHRIILEADEVRILKRSWFQQETIIPLAQVEAATIENQIRQPYSLSLEMSDGRKRRFWAGQIRMATWAELAYDLAELGVSVHLKGDFDKWVEY